MSVLQWIALLISFRLVCLSSKNVKMRPVSLGLVGHSAGANSPQAKERIPCLDGLRAFSIFLVLFAHSVLSVNWPQKWGESLQRAVFPYGVCGVDVFFVISGFLITRLLISEHLLSGGINVLQFYRRRVLRIFPAFYTYILVVCALCFLGILSVTPLHLLSAATFTGNFFTYPNPSRDDWNIGHFWTLAYEEQFYLFWPATLLLMSPSRSFFFPLAWVLAAPVVRLFVYLLWPSLCEGVPNLYNSCDFLMMGSLAALWKSQQLPWARPVNIPLYAPIAGLVFFLVSSPVLWHMVFRSFAARIYQITIQPEINSICIVMVLLWLVENSKGWTGRLLEQPFVVHIGVMSYSLYVWQQLFLGEAHKSSGIYLPLKLALVFVVAEFSFRFIEGPFRRKRPS